VQQVLNELRSDIQKSQNGQMVGPEGFEPSTNGLIGDVSAGSGTGGRPFRPAVGGYHADLLMTDVLGRGRHFGVTLERKVAEHQNEATLRRFGLLNSQDQSSVEEHRPPE